MQCAQFLWTKKWEMNHHAKTINHWIGANSELARHNAHWGWTFFDLYSIAQWIDEKKNKREERNNHIVANGITNRNHVQLVFICMKLNVFWPVCSDIVPNYRLPYDCLLPKTRFILDWLYVHSFSRSLRIIIIVCDAIAVQFLVIRCLLLTFVHIFFIPLYICSVGPGLFSPFTFSNQELEQFNRFSGSRSTKNKDRKIPKNTKAKDRNVKCNMNSFSVHIA